MSTIRKEKGSLRTHEGIGTGAGGVATIEGPILALPLPLPALLPLGPTGREGVAAGEGGAELAARIAGSGGSEGGKGERGTF